MRSFEDKPATRTRVPLLCGVMGPSGGGKTYSMLRLATGIQRVAGGDIYVIDTEARRALHYADRFKFRHIEFGAPFSPLDYLQAIDHCVKKGAGIVIVDSMSHEHEGQGGVLEMHEAEVQRLSRGDASKAERVKMLAWAKPKQERRRLINALLQMSCNFLFAFRAKEKVKLERGKDPESMGFMPIAGDEFIYEMTLNALLLPNAGGVPTWQSNQIGERMMIKLPEQFRRMLLESREPLSEDTGEQLARWAAGDAVGTPAGRTDSTPPPAGPIFNWKSNADWHEKPLRAAPLEVLRAYKSTIANALANTKNDRVADRMRGWLEEADAEMEAAEADAAMAGSNAAE